MKKIAALLIALAFGLIVALPAFSAISTPVVRVTLTKATVITQEQLNEKVALYKEAYGEEMDSAAVLDAMVSDELLKQAMERDGYVLNDDAKNELLAAQKAQIEEQYGVKLTDEQFANVILSNYGVDLDTFKDYIAEQYTVQNYVLTTKADMFTSDAVSPTNAEVEEFYKRNRTSFISPENVKLSHIYFEVKSDASDADKASILKKATDVSNQIKAGKISFEKAVTQYSDDKNSIDKAGDIGWLAINDTDNIKAMGQNFFDEVFKLDTGDVSSVIESNAGYHIVKVSIHNDTKILALDDKTSPTSDITVRDYIANVLYENKMNAVFQQAYMSLISDLKKSASIRYLTK